MTETLQQLIKQFNLLPHPEGGHYKETYRSAEVIPVNVLDKPFKKDRNFSTAIYFLLEQGNFSTFHRIQSDECWHFYAGGLLFIHVIYINGKFKTQLWEQILVLLVVLWCLVLILKILNWLKQMN